MKRIVNTETKEKGNGVLAFVSGAVVENEQAFVSGNAIVENEQVVLYFQFDDDEPIEGVKCNGKEFTLKIPVENGFISFADGKKRFRLSVRHCR